MAEVRGTAKAVLQVGVARPISRKLFAAAEEMERRGYIRSRLVAESGRCCALGALGIVEGLFSDASTSLSVEYRRIGSIDAARYLAQYIRDNGLFEEYTEYSGPRAATTLHNDDAVATAIFCFNDWVNNEPTMINVFKAAATAAFEEGL